MTKRKTARRVFIWALLLGLFFAGCETANGKNPGGVPDAENEFAAEAMTSRDSLSYFTEEGLAVGWNLGNALDAYSNGVSSETVWGNPRITQEIFNGVRAAGYTIARIPVTWMGHIGGEPDYHIDEDFLRRVAEVVGYAHDAGLKVIINIHHDGSVEKNGDVTRDNGWLSLNTARRSEEGMRQVTAQFERVWTQIAKYFKNYGDYLMFEAFNELHDGNWGWGDEAVQRPQYDILNKWTQVFVDAVRGVGGNNRSRFLIIPGYCAVPKHTTAPYFVLPNDNGNEANKLVVAVHYYDPYEFCIAGTRHDWGSAADKSAVNAVFKSLSDRFIAGKLTPVIIGESGVVRHEGYEQTRLEYFSYVYGKARDFGLVPMYWDNGAFSSGEKFGLFDRRTGKPHSPESQTVIETMVRACGGAD
ncbi:MAG: glycoside hydrolase family 5 protein [Treponema sp.]|jgi:endoglucanase|nr:glycoside hydrolase family 5 protein [Treponema sp.]